MNQVLPASTASRWVESLAKVPNATETHVRKLIGDNSDLEALLNGEAQSAFDRVFGEELPVTPIN
jgi:hypothetical protein